MTNAIFFDTVKDIFKLEEERKLNGGVALNFNDDLLTGCKTQERYRLSKGTDRTYSKRVF